MFIHLFAIRQRIFEPLMVDSMYVVDNTNPLVMLDEQTYQAALELSHVPEEVIKERKMISGYIIHAEWRQRYNSDIYHKVLRLDAEVKMDFEQLDVYLNSLPEDRLKAKLKAMEF